MKTFDATNIHPSLAALAAHAAHPGCRIVRVSDTEWTVYERGDALPPEATAPYVPAEVTMRQARLVLLAARKLDAVEAAINGLPEAQRVAARIEWDYSSTVRRRQPLVLALAPALGFDDAALDAMFIAAEAL